MWEQNACESETLDYSKMITNEIPRKMLNDNNHGQGHLQFLQKLMHNKCQNVCFLCNMMRRQIDQISVPEQVRGSLKLDGGGRLYQGVHDHSRQLCEVPADRCDRFMTPIDWGI